MSSIQSSAESISNFGQEYAVLNLDIMSLLIDNIKDTAEGQEFISSFSRWNDALHQKDPRPLTVFTSLFFSHPSQHELANDKPFANLVKAFGTFEKGSSGVQISPHFTIDEKDVVLQKTRWYAGSGNSLEQILKAQNIDTVIIVSYSHHNVLELPVDHNADFSKVLLSTLLPKMNLNAISIDEALQALERS
ncbi:hypothetical protein AAE478_008792 [Parahypoxylon ruwenzoriense]